MGAGFTVVQEIAAMKRSKTLWLCEKMTRFANGGQLTLFFEVPARRTAQTMRSGIQLFLRMLYDVQLQ